MIALGFRLSVLANGVRSLGQRGVRLHYGTLLRSNLCACRPLSRGRAAAASAPQTLAQGYAR